MPLYEYQCDACGHRFEVIRKFSDEPLEGCPKCGGHIQKLISAPAFAFKGTGWYVTDYAKKDSVAPGKSDGESKDPGSKDSKDTGASDAGGKDSKDAGEKGAKDSKDQGAKDSSTKDQASTPAKTESSTKSESSPAPDKSA
jgi:putative FmdB family regulatory protein